MVFKQILSLNLVLSHFIFSEIWFYTLKQQCKDTGFQHSVVHFGWPIFIELYLYSDNWLILFALFSLTIIVVIALSLLFVVIVKMKGVKCDYLW